MIPPRPGRRFRTALGAAIPLAAILAAATGAAQSPGERVRLPEGYRDGVHYATVQRGGIAETLYVAPEAIAAARAGAPFPEGTAIVMEDRRGGSLHRILVMEKRAEWAPESAAGGWFFAEFAPDGTPNLSEDYGRCQACHASREASDFVFTRGRMTD